MKRIYLLCLAYLTMLCLSAQNFEHYWQNVEAALKADRPKTALATLDTICREAIEANENGWLLRSMLVRQTCCNNLSPDSGAVALKQLETVLHNVQNDTTQALWHAALARIYAQKAHRDTTSRSTAKAHFMSALDDLARLSQSHTTAYPELFDYGTDSRFFAHDLLSVVALPALDFFELHRDPQLWQQLQRLQQHYRRKGMRAATLLVTLDSIGRAQAQMAGYTSQKALQRLQQLAQEYADEEANVETYLRIVALPSMGDTQMDSIKYVMAQRGWERYRKQKRAAALQNHLREMQQPWLMLCGVASEVFPGQTLVAQIEARNITKAELRIIPLHTDAVAHYWASTSSDYQQWLQQQKRGKVQKWLVRLLQKPPYALQKDSIRFSLSQPGIYLLQLRTNEKLLEQTTIVCSRVKTICTTLPDASVRLQIVDAESGQPMAGEIVLYKQNGQKIASQSSDKHGALRIQAAQARQTMAFAQIAGDLFSAPVRLHYYSQQTKKPAERHMVLYSDRSIYRPGQQILLGGLCYLQTADETEVAKHRNITLTLYNAQGKSIDTLLVKTDEMGCFDAAFGLPATCLPGTFRVQANYAGEKQWLSLRVEEYRRPTFYIETTSRHEEVVRDDSLTVDGILKTYTDLPIENARIKWRATHHYYYRAPHHDNYTEQGETASDANGNFAICIARAKTEPTTAPWQHVGYYRIEIEATAPNGETIQTTHLVRSTQKAYTLSCAWPEWLWKEQNGKVNIHIHSHLGEMETMEGSYTLWHFASPSDSTQMGTYAFRSGTSFCPEGLQQLPSGRYKAAVRATAPNGQVLQQSLSFHLYSLNDRRPLSHTDFLQHSESDPETGHARLTIASSADSVVLFYDLLSQHHILESRIIVFSDSILHFSLPYHESHGDGATLHLAFAKKGKLYTTSIHTVKPRPDKALQFSWRTFRSHLSPGAHEEWQLQVQHTDGRPANASIVARLYDSALDALSPTPRLFHGLYFPRHFFHTYVSTQQAYPISLSGSLSKNLLKEISWQPSRWKEQLFAYAYGAHEESIRRVFTSAKPSLMKNAVTAEGATFDTLAEAMVEESGASEVAEATALRTDFSETAFFMPRLRTDANGVASLVFTLPQSLTTWQFNALAHTHDMHYALLDTTIVARKQWMIVPSLPRFLYSGDATAIPATLQNLTDRPQSAMVRMEWRDAHTDVLLHSEVQQVDIAPQQSHTLSFSFRAPQSSALLVVRTTASAPGFSDGEEHLLPILANETEVVRTLPFVLTDTLTHRLRIDTLWQVPQAHHRRLTLELSSHPTWYAVQALPSVAQTEAEDALSLATAYYALTLAELTAQQHPTIRKQVEQLSAQAPATSPFLQATAAQEMPWYREEQAERKRIQHLSALFDDSYTSMRRHSATDRLRTLQQADGSWSWFKGMRGNKQITLDVALLLARIEAVVPHAATKEMLQKAMHYLHREWERELKHNQQSEVLHSRQLQYLYLCALTGELQRPHIQTLLQRLYKATSFGSLLDKAYATHILALVQKADAALYHAQGLWEHTLLQPNGARLFDSRRAPIAATSYRIPMQVAAIEAFEACCALPGAPQQQLREGIEQMRLWLLLAKRTQSWETARATTDALRLLLSPTPAKASLIKSTEESSHLYWEIKQQRNTIDRSPATEQASAIPTGHLRKAYAPDAPETAADSLLAQGRKPCYLHIRQSGKGLAWGSISATMTQATSAVDAFGAGMQLTRHFEVLRGGQWLPLSPATLPVVGERVRQVVTLTTHADYDFVSLRTPFPACLSPIRPLSGYTHTIATGGYRVVRDATVECYFDHLPKGTYHITEEYFVHRTGHFHSGSAQATCVYAPEYRAHSTDAVVSSR